MCSGVEVQGTGSNIFRMTQLQYLSKCTYLLSTTEHNETSFISNMLSFRMEGILALLTHQSSLMS